MFTKLTALKTILLVCCLFSVDFAQSNGAVTRIQGTVLGPAEMVIPDASVTLTNLTDRTALHATSNQEGVFVFEGVKPGRYELSTGAEWAFR